MSELLIGLAGLALGVFGAWLSFDSRNRALLKEKQRELEQERERYADGEKKKYAAERDFQHLKRNQEQLKDGLKVISQELEERVDQLEAGLQRIELMLEIGFKSTTGRRDDGH